MMKNLTSISAVPPLPSPVLALPSPRDFLPMPIQQRLPSLGADAPDYSRCLYADPPSHDFCVFLIIAEMVRRYHKSPAPLRVKFVLLNGRLGILDFGPNSIRSSSAFRCSVGWPYYQTMLKNVMRPAMEMIGAIEDAQTVELGAPLKYEDVAHHVEYDYHLLNVTDAARAGFDIPRWKVPQWALDEVDAFLGDEKPVVITLRENAFQPERNSQIAEWVRFAASVTDRPVLFVRDTAKATQPLTPFKTWPRAALNTFVRAALYQRAFVNLMVCTGPTVWCMFSDAPYVMFKQLVPALPYWDHGQPTGWRQQDHIDVGTQLPWARDTQVLAWADDTFENIREAYDRFVGER